MDDYGNLRVPSLRRRVGIALAIFCALLVIFHRPLLLTLAHRIVLHYAAKENLKLDFQVEGNLFTNLTVRNVHAVATGICDIESIDADYARVDYSLWKLIRHGLSDSFSNAEVRNARVVVDTDKGPPPKPKNPNKKETLYDFFPERVHVTDATVIIRDHPHDFVMEHVDLTLDPRSPGELKVGKLQLFGGQTWENVLSRTSYANRDLVLRDVVISKDERIRSMSLDASQIAAGKLAINLDYPIGAGIISGVFEFREAKASLDARLHLRIANAPAGFINKYVTLPEDCVTGQIEKLEVDLDGLLNSPRTWNGKLLSQIRDFRMQPATFDHGVFEITAKDGKTKVQSGEIVQGQNHFRLSGEADLPNNIKEFGRTPATLEIVATAPDLKEVTATMAQKVSGSAEGKIRLDIANGKIDATVGVTGKSLVFSDGAIETLSANIKATKIVPPRTSRLKLNPPPEKPWFDGLESEGTVVITNPRLRNFTADSVEANLHSASEIVTVDRLLVRRKQNEFLAHGEYQLPQDFAKAAGQPAKIDISLNAPEVGDYWAGESPDKFTGPLQMNGQLEWKNGAVNGQLWIYGAGLKTRDLVFHQLSSQAVVTNSVVYLNDFTASLNEHDFVGANAVVDLRAPYRYRGKISANVENLAVFEPLLRASGNRRSLGGSFVMDWEGSGEGKTFKNDGKLKLVMEKGRYGDMKALQANVDAAYTPEGLEVPIIFFGSDKMNFQAIAQAKGDTFEITKIELNQGKAKYASGYVSIPFVWKNLGTGQAMSPADGKVAVTFQSENLDLKKLFEDFGMRPPVSGLTNIKFDANGTLGKLDARLDVQMRELRSAETPKFEPATFDLSAVVQNNELQLNGKLQQAKIQPLELTAHLPFDAVKMARFGKLPDDTPVTAKVRLPRSSVNFIRQFAPVLQQIDGDVALDVDVTGTLGKPILTGAGDMTINVARSTNTTVPALTNFKARLEFRDDTLTLQQFGGDLSGGKFTMTGGAKFPKLTQPELDLTFKAESALIARSDSLTARADADIKIVGPFASATVTGTIATTNSNFLKNIDLLPIGLPGRPPPQPPEERPEFTFPTPPIRDWKFDVALKTKDPFKIRGNLAYGGAVADIHLGGTGLHPGLQGQIRLENVEATLPFSRLEIAYGFLYFDPGDSLNPKMDLHGRSVIRDYTIHVYIYGTAVAPEAVFSSEPPLPQEEIISLLATGTTRAELTGNNNVLAGRAAMLLVQQLYRKIFKKGGGTENTSVFDRLDLEVGQTDPRTGQQQATARFKLNDQFVLLGDLDVGGGFKGMVKYLIRFH